MNEYTRDPAEEALSRVLQREGELAIRPEAEALGLSRAALYRRLEKFGLAQDG